MSISKQLMIMLTIALCGLMTIFGISMIKMDQVYDKANYANDNSLPSVLLLDSISQDTFRVRLYMWQHLAQTDEKEMAKLEQSINKMDSLINDNLKKYEKLLSDDTDKELLQKDRDVKKAYFEFLQKAIKLSQENQKEASRNYILQNTPIGLELTNVFVNHMQYNEKLATEGAKIAVETKQNANFLMIILAIAIAIDHYEQVPHLQQLA